MNSGHPLRILASAFAILLASPLPADDLAARPDAASNAKILAGLFERVERGSLLDDRGPGSEGPGSGGIRLKAKEGTLDLNDIAFTAKVILNLGLEGLEECYRRLDGSNQSARIVSIYALNMASGDSAEDLLRAQLPMVGTEGGKPRDLTSTEIQELKNHFGPILAKLRENQNKWAEQGGAGQPAASPESDPDGGEKPQPESDRPSR